MNEQSLQTSFVALSKKVTTKISLLYEKELNPIVPKQKEAKFKIIEKNLLTKQTNYLTLLSVNVNLLKDIKENGQWFS